MPSEASFKRWRNSQNLCTQAETGRSAKATAVGVVTPLAAEAAEAEIAVGNAIAAIGTKSLLGICTDSRLSSQDVSIHVCRARMG